jgi:hypothetical protein
MEQKENQEEEGGWCVSAQGCCVSVLTEGYWYAPVIEEVLTMVQQSSRTWFVRHRAVYTHMCFGGGGGRACWANGQLLVCAAAASWPVLQWGACSPAYQQQVHIHHCCAGLEDPTVAQVQMQQPHTLAELAASCHGCVEGLIVRHGSVSPGAPPLGTPHTRTHAPMHRPPFHCPLVCSHALEAGD